MEETEAWLYDEGMDTNKTAYQSRLEKFKKVTDPIDKRILEFELLPELFQKFREGIAYYD